MSLTGKQKSSLWFLFGVTFITCFIGGLAYLVVWSDSTASVQHYCSGTTMITITTDNSGGQSTAVQFDDPRCR